MERFLFCAVWFKDVLSVLLRLNTENRELLADLVDVVQKVCVSIAQQDV